MNRSSFVVNATPYCMWGVDLPEQNRRFLLGLDPRFFSYQADVHVAAFESSAVRFASDGGLVSCFVESDYLRVAPHTI
jgi:hypothetical protein